MQCSCSGFSSVSTPSLAPKASASSWKQLEKNYTVPVLVFASPIYWPDEAERLAAFEQVRTHISAKLSDWDVSLGEWLLVDSPEAMKSLEAGALAGGCAAFLPMSGGIQPWMKIAAGSFENVLLVNAYLPDLLDASLSHASCTGMPIPRPRTSLPIGRWQAKASSGSTVSAAWQTPAAHGAPASA